MTLEAVLERLQCFLRWNAHRIDALDVSHEPIANAACFTRGKAGKLEYWITAETWRTELFPDDEDGTAPKAIASSGLLRLPKEPANFQICAGIRKKITKVYAVRAGIMTAKVNGSNGAAHIELPSILSPTLPAGGPTLTAKLEDVVSLSLDEAESILRVRVSPDDRAYQAVLRAKTAVFNGRWPTRCTLTKASFVSRTGRTRLPPRWPSCALGGRLTKAKFPHRAKFARLFFVKIGAGHRRAVSRVWLRAERRFAQMRRDDLGLVAKGARKPSSQRCLKPNSVARHANECTGRAGRPECARRPWRGAAQTAMGGAGPTAPRCGLAGLLAGRVTGEQACPRRGRPASSMDAS
jgi:hypothetical protein